MSDHTQFVRENLHRLWPAEPFFPSRNPTFGNPDFEDASYRVLIVRLSPFRDVDRSIPHLFLFQEVRRALPRAFIDLAFFPTAPQRELFERENVPFLIGVQSLRPADEFDLLLISNAYTLELINLPYLLIHSGIPLFSSRRGAEDPVVILGGSNAAASQAIMRADGDSLVDGIFFGEGEGVVGELVHALEALQSSSSFSEESLASLGASIPGFWAAGALRPTRQAICTPGPRYLPLNYPILNTPEAHTANLQINYGCPAFCSFCFEGYDRKPYRELPLTEILPLARRLKRAQGVEELGIYSFNFNTHSDVLEMILALHQLFDRVSFKSQRLDVLQQTPTLLEAEVTADKRDFTLGIEGISERQRAWLHKSLSAETITSLLDRLLALKIRRIKLFYVLTGHESGEDIAEFRRFVKWLKRARRAHSRRPRVIFSFGLLIRMPFTPLRYDRLILDEATWRPLIGQTKSACETNGFEFRMAFDWPGYCATQVLAMGGYWLVEPVVELARQGYCFDTTLPPDYWHALRGWMERNGHWNEDFLGQKGADYAFALEFVEPRVSAEFLYRQYTPPSIPPEDEGYCLGSRDERGRCLGCGACIDEKERQAIVRHRVHEPEAGRYLAQLRAVMAHKRQIRPTYLRLRLEDWLAGVLPEFLNAFVFKGLLTRYPESVDNLLSVRESLFTVRPNDASFPTMGGETVFALTAWDAGRLQQTLADPREHVGPGFEIVGPAEGFTPGAFTRLHLELFLPEAHFPEPRTHLEQYLRGAYLPYSLRREGERLHFDLPDKALKKRILFGGFIETDGGEEGKGFYASLEAGPKFDLLAFLEGFGAENLAHHARARVSQVEW